jgi:hypothetical protein
MRSFCDKRDTALSLLLPMWFVPVAIRKMRFGIDLPNPSEFRFLCGGEERNAQFQKCAARANLCRFSFRTDAAVFFPSFGVPPRFLLCSPG